MKKNFEKAEVEVIRFEENDVIATSGTTYTAVVEDPVEVEEGSWD